MLFPFRSGPLPLNSLLPCRCNSIHFQCLKLYCECFAAHVYCTPGACNCNDCHNLSEFESVRVKAIEAALTRNIDAFTNKVTKAEKRASLTTSVGCNCRKSRCLKKYCECFFTNTHCTAACKCTNCENYIGSIELSERREQLRLEQEAADLAKEEAAAAALQSGAGAGAGAGATANGWGYANGSRVKTKGRVGQDKLQAGGGSEPSAERAPKTPGVSSKSSKADLVNTDFAKKMKGLAVSPKKPNSKLPTSSSTYRDFKPTDLYLGEQDSTFTAADWEYAAEMAAYHMDESGANEGPLSTKSLSGKSPSHKKGRIFSPRTTEAMAEEKR